MSEMKPCGPKVMLDGNEYELRFTINAIDDMQDHYNTGVLNLRTLLTDDKKWISNERYLLTVLINEGIDCHNDETGERKPHLSERYVGRHMNAYKMKEITSAICQAFNAGIPTETNSSDEDTSDNSPNA